MEELTRCIFIPHSAPPVELFVYIPEDQFEAAPHCAAIQALCGTTFFKASDSLLLFGAIPEHAESSARVLPNINLIPLLSQLMPTGSYLLTTKIGGNLPDAITPANLADHLVFTARWEDEFIVEHDLRQEVFPVEQADDSSSSRTSSVDYVLAPIEQVEIEIEDHYGDYFNDESDMVYHHPLTAVLKQWFAEHPGETFTEIDRSTAITIVRDDLLTQTIGYEERVWQRVRGQVIQMIPFKEAIKAKLAAGDIAGARQLQRDAHLFYYPNQK
jgi:hypothetical protein